MALVVFSDKAAVIFKLTAMDDNGRKICTSLLDSQNPHGKTNLWGGLLASLDILREGQEPGVFRKTQIMCLTDGMPTISPPRGHHMELRDY
jgi:Mg-chelatase subunit ChlD